MATGRKPPPKPRVGLALGSGVARGWAHIGVLNGLRDIGVAPDIVCGTSAGALVAGNFLAGRLGEFETWARGLSPMGVLRYLDIGLGSGGVFGGRRLEAFLREILGRRRIEDLDTPFAAVATDLATGHEVWVREGPLVDAIMASYALPGAFAPVRVDGRWLIDGALVNPVPVSVCRALGARLVIAVNLNAEALGRPRFIEDGDDLAAGLDAAPETKNDRGVAGLADRVRPVNLILRQLLGHGVNAPSMLSTMAASFNIMQDRLCRTRLAGDPPDVMVVPRLGHVGLFEFHRAAECIDEGAAALKRLTPVLEEALSVLGDWPGPGRP